MANKILKLLLALPFIIFMAGCKPDPAVIPSNLQNPLLAGKWLLKSLDVETQIDNNPPTSFNFNTFTDKDYFEFKANNAATYSSSAIGASYNGYYSTDMSLSPNPIKFVSNDFSETFYLKSVTADTLIIYQTASNTSFGVTTTVTNTYTYKH
jgi:hypothetical protein